MNLPSTKHISVEPVMLVGLTGSELIIMIVLAILFAAVFALLLYLALPGVGLQIFTLWFVGTIVISKFIQWQLVRTKRNKPNGYYQQAIRIMLSNWFGGGFESGDVINYQGPWDYVRHR